MTCTFFGHRDTPESIRPILRATLIDLIENKGATRFYVGNNGLFDAMVTWQLRRLKSDYPHIDYAVVLTYLPTKAQTDDTPTLYPESQESALPRYAISKRNHWMLRQADYVVTYVNTTIGGAAKFQTLAQKKGKTVVNLADFG